VLRAAGGTLCFDEVGDLHLDGQPMLLRLLENRIFLTRGSDAEQCTDACFIACTNRDLGGMVEEGTFRDDLFGRLTTGIWIHIPPLRARPEDIAPLVLARAARRGVTLSSEACRAFEHLVYRGNVRELLGAVERVIALSAGRRIDADMVRRFAPAAPPALAERPSSTGSASTAQTRTTGSLDVDGCADLLLAEYGFHLADARAHLIRRGVIKTQGNRSAAARLLGLGYGAVRDACEDECPRPKDSGERLRPARSA
jgi:two-component system nitrogen regulation response regulator GlnG